MNSNILTESRPGDSCLICGEVPAVIGIFKPEEPETWGAPAGKTRLIRYCLCVKCHGKPETPENAEKIIRGELSGGGVKDAS
jgi:hypothetical protein